MTRGIENTLGLSHMDEINEESLKNMEEFDQAVPSVIEDKKESLIEGILNDADHGNAMDEVYKEVLQHGRDLVDLGFNSDPSKMRGIYEQAANFYKLAIDAKNSKRDLELKAKKLVMDVLKSRGTTIDVPALGETPKSDVVITADRNELLKQIKANKGL